ncbi:4985_t:CDS:2, partial [Diversispora eburnea]
KDLNNDEFIAKYYGISKNPSTQNYIIVMDLFEEYNFCLNDSYVLLQIDLGLLLRGNEFTWEGNIYSFDGIMYLDLMYRCWSDDLSERSTSTELRDLIWEIYDKLCCGYAIT